MQKMAAIADMITKNHNADETHAALWSGKTEQE
jgi:hypothetical protein